MPFKKYISPNRQNFFTSIVVKGVSVQIAFLSQKHGGMQIGTLGTSDHDLIEALDADKRFECVSGEVEAVKSYVKVQDDGFTRVPADEVSGFQQAKKYLITKGFCTSADLSDAESVLKYTKENNIIFLGYNQKRSPQA